MDYYKKIVEAELPAEIKEESVMKVDGLGDRINRILNAEPYQNGAPSRVIETSSRFRFPGSMID